MIELEHVTKLYGSIPALRDVSLHVPQGQTVGLLGRNGAGKTTTIRIVMDVFPADSGEVLIDGRPIDYSKIGTGYLPEERGLYPKKPIDEQLLYFARLKGMNRTDATRAIDYWLDRLDMAAFKQKKLQTLSKGNQQKIQLMLALLSDPELLILDEPLSGLDPVNTDLFKSILR